MCAEVTDPSSPLKDPVRGIPLPWVGGFTMVPFSSEILRVWFSIFSDRPGLWPTFICSAVPGSSQRDCPARPVPGPCLWADKPQHPVHEHAEQPSSESWRLCPRGPRWLWFGVCCSWQPDRLHHLLLPKPQWPGVSPVCGESLGRHVWCLRRQTHQNLASERVNSLYCFVDMKIGACVANRCCSVTNETNDEVPEQPVLQGLSFEVIVLQLRWDFQVGLDHN